QGGRRILLLSIRVGRVRRTKLALQLRRLLCQALAAVDFGQQSAANRLVRIACARYDPAFSGGRDESCSAHQTSPPLIRRPGGHSPPYKNPAPPELAGSSRENQGWFARVSCGVSTSCTLSPSWRSWRAWRKWVCASMTRRPPR